MLARRMGKTRVIAETGAGQHGVATATACALFGLECTVYMGEEDIRRQKLNVFNMRTHGGRRSCPVTTGSRTLRDATNEAMRDWMGSSKQTHYTIGSVVGPHPFPMIVRDFQSVIGRETRAAVPGAGSAGCPTRSSPASAAARTRRACSIRSSTTPRSSWSAPRPAAAGRRPGEHASSLTQGRPGVLHGSFSYVLQDDDGQTPGRPLDLRRARLPRRRPRAQLLEGHRPRPLREHHRHRGARRLQHHRPAARASCPPWSRATPWPRRSRRPAASAPARSWSSASPAAATRTPTRSPGSAGSRSESWQWRVAVTSGSDDESAPPTESIATDHCHCQHRRPLITRPLATALTAHCRQPMNRIDALFSRLKRRRPPRPDAVRDGGRSRPARPRRS